MDTTVCASVTVTVKGESKPETEATTTVYYPKSVFGESTTPSFQYSLDSGTTWTKNLSMESSDCNGWWKITFKNPDKKSFKFDVYDATNNIWDNGGGTGKDYSYAYAAELTLSGSIKNGSSISAGTLTEGAPSGCSVTPPASSETVTITSPTTSSVTLDKGKTLALTATKTPSTTTLTWSSGNTSVAKVEKNASDTTATLTALAVGTATIRVRTASGAAASITVTVRDGTQLTVYFKTNAVSNSWSGYWLAYQQKGNGKYATVQMTRSTCNSEYVVASIPRDQVQEGYGYYFRDNGNLDNNRQWYGSNGVSSEGEPFQFPGGSYTSLRVESNSTKQTSAPSGCETSNAKSAARSAAKATARSAAKTRAKATAKTRAKTTATNSTQATAQQRKSASGVAVQSGESGVSTTADTDIETDTGADTAGGGTAGGTDAETIYSCGDAQGRCDMDATVGSFRIVDLEAGTYTLTEIVAPNGFAGTEASYAVTIKADGSTTWDPALTTDSTAGVSKVPNTRMTGTVTWNKVAKVKQTASSTEKAVKLAGSEWTITQMKSFTWSVGGKAAYTQILAGDQTKYTITDCVNGQSTDAQGNTITDCSAQSATQTTPYVDLDGAAGQFKLTGLGWGTYELKETKAPEGYTVDGTTRTFTFGPAQGADITGQWYQNTVGSTAGSATSTTTSTMTATTQVSYDQQVFHFDIGNIANTRTLGTVTWQKVGSDDTSKPLAGSTWRLVQKTAYNTATGVYVELTTLQTYGVIDCTASGSQSPCGTGAGTGKQGENTWNDSDSSAGKFKLEQLPWGEYTLVETAAPRGYTPKAEEIAFTVGPTKAGQANASQDKTSSEPTQSISLTIDLGSVVNQKTVIATAIPMTGGDWTGRDILAVGGGLALLAGICAMARKHSRRKVIPRAQPRL